MQRVLQALKRQRVGDQEPSIKAEVDASRTSSPWDRLFQVKYHLVIFHSSPWNITIFKNGKPSINYYKWAIYTMAMLNNQRVIEPDRISG